MCIYFLTYTNIHTLIGGALVYQWLLLSIYRTDVQSNLKSSWPTAIREGPSAAIASAVCLARFSGIQRRMGKGVQGCVWMLSDGSWQWSEYSRTYLLGGFFATRFTKVFVRFASLTSPRRSSNPCYSGDGFEKARPVYLLLEIPAAPPFFHRSYHVYALLALILSSLASRPLRRRENNPRAKETRLPVNRHLRAKKFVVHSGHVLLFDFPHFSCHLPLRSVFCSFLLPRVDF